MTSSLNLKIEIIFIIVKTATNISVIFQIKVGLKIPPNTNRKQVMIFNIKGLSIC